MMARTTGANRPKRAKKSRSDSRPGPMGGLRPETGARGGTANVRLARERLTDRGEGFFDCLLAALERLVESVLAVLEPREGLGGRADLLIEGFEAGEVDVGARTGRRDHTSPRLCVA